MSRQARQKRLSTLPPGASAHVRRDRLQAVIAAIGRGEHDGELALLHDAVVDRIETMQAMQTAAALLAIDVGDRVALNDTVRPHYLRGATGTVTSLLGDQVVVALDQPIGRFRSGELRCSPLALEKPGPALLPAQAIDSWHPHGV
jgi:hypothetical protein